ncbi:hypothetical protein [Corynebacterium mustelae]|nr:hypothetical protein [Corynebacterium mustelae]
MTFCTKTNPKWKSTPSIRYETFVGNKSAELVATLYPWSFDQREP